MIQNFNQSQGGLDFNQGINPGKAVLLLISPRGNIQNHWHRPLSLNFTSQVTDSIVENIITRPSSHPVDSILKSCPEINQAVLPSPQGGFGMNISAYNHHWWFALMLDTNTDGIITNRLATRYIYLGICSEDPVGNVGIASATPEAHLNPNCQLVITRAVTMRRHSTLGVNGMTDKVRTVNNLEVANFDSNVFGNVAGPQDNFYSMLPSTVKNQVIFSDGHQPEMTSLLDSSDSLNVKRQDRLPGELESPRMYMKNILRSLETGAMMFNSGSEMAGFGVEGLDDHLMEGGQKFETCVNHSFGQERQLINVGSDNDPLRSTYLTLGMIVGKYCPKVAIVQSQTNLMMDIIPQDMTSPNNIMSTMICATIPSYLIQLGLSAVSFMYNSFNNATRVEHIESSVQCTQEELSTKWKNLEALLRFDLYPVIHANCGDFDLQIMSSLNGTTDCILNLLDFTPLPIGAIYREETGLGGMISPMIGTGSQLVNNGCQLNSLIRQVSDSVNMNIPTNY